MTGYTVLIDGYNVWHRMPGARRDPASESARRTLLEAVRTARWPDPVERVIVVFDGPETSRQPAARGIAVWFAPCADDAIRGHLRAHPDPRRCLVISDDRDISHTAAALGARRESVRWLLQRLAGSEEPHPKLPTRDLPAPHPKKPSEARQAGLPAATARRITEELRARWLKGGAPRA